MAPEVPPELLIVGDFNADDLYAVEVLDAAVTDVLKDVSVDLVALFSKPNPKPGAFPPEPVAVAVAVGRFVESPNHVA